MMMTRFYRILTLGALLLLVPDTTTAFISSPHSLRQSRNSDAMIAHAMDFKQQPGESDIDFIKRITASSKNMLNENEKQAAKARQQSQNVAGTNDASSNATETKPRGTYKRIEEWDEERKASGELTWEEKVQYEGQRFGNQVRQNDILSKHIGSFFFGDVETEGDGAFGSSRSDAIAMAAALDPRGFYDRPNFPSRTYLQRQFVKRFLQSYFSTLSLIGKNFHPSLNIPTKGIRIQQSKKQQWSVELSEQRKRRRSLAASSSSPSSVLTSESSSFPSSQQKILNNAIQDAAASFTQESCQLLGVKSVGVDYGLVKTGVAVTVGYNPEPLEILVWERPPRSNYDGVKDGDKEPPILGNITQIASQVVQITKREQASQIILGLPLHKNGTEAEQTNHTRVFAQELARQSLQYLGPNIPVYLWDERYTSKEAAARAHSKDPDRYLYGTLDSEAACIILEHYYKDNGLGAERVVVEDELWVEKYTKEWEERVRVEEERLAQQEQNRQDRLNWRKEAMLRDQMLTESDSEMTTSKKKKKKKKNKRR